ncbi:hypothetical protein IKM56_00075 [Candidatus Saccharibacteria bacterium]|nr:hypothetical protein [Candidatus Saccharibacteria bacterium]
MNKTRKIVLLTFKISIIVMAIVFLFRCIFDPNYSKWGGVIAGVILPFLPEIFSKLFRIKISYRVELMYYIFLILALSLGISADLYKTVPLYDKAVHTLSGAGTALIGFYMLRYFKAEKTPAVFRGMFMIFFSISVAVAWEFFEFFCDKCLGQHMQQLVTTGVDDTMLDMLVATIGAIIGGVLMANKKVQNFLEK